MWVFWNIKYGGNVNFVVFLYLMIVVVEDLLDVIVGGWIFLFVIMWGGLWYWDIFFLLMLKIRWGLFVRLYFLIMLFNFVKYFWIFFGLVVLVFRCFKFFGLSIWSLGYLFMKLENYCNVKGFVCFCFFKFFVNLVLIFIIFCFVYL